MTRSLPAEPAPPKWGAAASAHRGWLLPVLGELIQTLLIAGVLFFGVNLTTARIRVDGSSMEPGLHNNDLVVVNRLAYQADLPTRGDIIVFRYPYSPDRRFIKRLIGLPGDHVFVRDGTLYVNGMALEEPYISAPPEYDGSWVVGPGEVFVLGDNRNNSSDSQNWGMLPLEEIIGKAILVYWPPSDLGVIPHYNLAVAAAD